MLEKGERLSGLIHVESEALDLVADLRCIIEKNRQRGIKEWTAAKIGIKLVTLYRWLNGTVIPRDKSIIKLRTFIERCRRGEYQ